jgi:hypothetical protein
MVQKQYAIFAHCSGIELLHFLHKFKLPLRRQTKIPRPLEQVRLTQLGPDGFTDVRHSSYRQTSGLASRRFLYSAHWQSAIFGAWDTSRL